MQLIPKVFHRIWVGPGPLPETAKDYAASWQEHHPGWDMELWTDQNLPPGQFNRGIYEQTADPARRADILRHELLNQFGGVYIDIDYECLRNIEPLLEGVSYFYGEELSDRPGISILGCVAGHPFSRFCQLRIREHWPWQGSILQETGPDFYGRAVRSYLGEHVRVPHVDPLSHKQAGSRLIPTNGLPLHAFEPWVLYPYYLGETWVSQDHPDAYAVHHWQKNWDWEPSSPAVRAWRDGTDDTNIIIPELIDQDIYQIDRIVHALHDEEGIVLDCGAHIGVFSCLLAERGVTNTIHAFEPEPENFKFLAHNTSERETITAVNAAVGPTAGRMQLFDRGGTCAWSLVPEDPQGIPAVDVTVIDLCEHIRQVGRVALLKLDIEGFEPDILNAMPDEILERIHLLVVEEHHRPVDYDRLQRAGFSLWYAASGRPENRVYRRDAPWGLGKRFACHRPSDGPPKVLMVTNVERLSRRMDKNAYYRCRALSRQENVTVTGPGCDAFEEGMSVQDLVNHFGRPDLLIHGIDLGATGVPLVSGLAELDVPTAMEIEDSWENPEVRQRFLRENRFDYAFHTTRPREGAYREACPDTQFVWTPMAIRTDIFRDYRLEKVNDVLFYGATYDWYPLRVRLLRLLEGLADAGDLRVKIIPHPGYWDDGYEPQDGHYVGEKLAQEINKSWITIATGSAHGCLFAKHLEIAAAGSFVAGSLPDAARPFLGRGFADLDAEEDGEIVDRLHALLSDKDELIARTVEGHRRVHADFSVEAYSSNMLDLIGRLVSANNRESRTPAANVAD